MELTSIDYANYLRYLAMERFFTILNKTQVNKMLFICYGLYLSMTNKKLFSDDTPKAWPFGPVFPRVYKRFDNYQGISHSTIAAIQPNEQIKELFLMPMVELVQWMLYTKLVK